MKSDKKTFKDMLTLCYEQEEFEELHVELMSLDSETKSNKDPNKFQIGMREILNIIPLFTENFPTEIYSELENLYQEFLENE